MIHVHAAAERSTNSAAAESRIRKKCRKKVTLMVELDNMKMEIQAYETPLAEVRDSL